MKKIVSILLVCAMLTATLTACDSNKTSDNSSSTSSTSENSSTESSSSESSSSESSSSESSSTESNSADSSSTDDSIVVPDDPNNPGDGDGGEGVDNSGLEFPDNRAGALAKAALATDAWPAMDLVTDPEFVSAMFSADFNVDSYEEFCLSTNFISAAFNKVIIIKPKEGKEEEVSNAFKSYLTMIQDPSMMLYPDQEIQIAGTVTGETDDGYYYMIVHENGADIAAAMLAAE